MKYAIVAAASAALFCSSLAFGQAQETLGNSPSSQVAVTTPSVIWQRGSSVLYDNGPLVNSPGTGVGGADESVLQSSLGMITLGFGHALASGFRVADDFVVPASGWVIDSFTFFAYQTGSTTTSTMTAVNMRIWDGEPGQPGSTVVFGDDTTNVMTATAFSNIYRVTEATTGTANDRPIMAQTVGGLALNLAAGTYWVDWQTDGSLGSGPWAPPITINGSATTGDALQFDPGVSTWSPAVDTGASSAAQGFPFVINGELPGIPLAEARELPTLGNLGLLLASLMLLGLGLVALPRHG